MKKVILVISLSTILMLSYFALPLSKPMEMVKEQAQFGTQYALAKTINAAQFSDAQLQIIYNGAKNAREQLEDLKQNISDLENSALDYIIAGDEEASAQAISNAKEAAGKATEILTVYFDTVKGTVTVEQLENMMPQKPDMKEMISELKEKYEQLPDEKKEMLEKNIKGVVGKLQQIPGNSKNMMNQNSVASKIKSRIQNSNAFSSETMLKAFTGLLISDQGFEVLEKFVVK